MAFGPLALLLADGRTPTGGHAHSGGLEAAVNAGLRVDGVPGFIRGRLHTCAFGEAAFAAAATRAAAAQQPGELARLDLEARARVASPMLRDASTTLGRSLLRTASRMFPGRAVLEAYRHDSATTPRPVAFGVVADAAGLAPLEAATISLHSDLTAVAASAVKLLPVDAAGAFGWVAALATEIERCAARAATPVASSELPSVSATLVELRSLRHGRDGGRLFAT